MRVVRMRYSNDCVVASVACALRRPYAEVLRAARRIGFRPNSKTGVVIAALVWELGYDCDSLSRWTTRAVFDGEDFVRFARVLRPPRMPMKQPLIASVPSVNNRDGFHAIVVDRGRVMDPTRKRRVSFDLFARTRRTTHYNFRRD